MENIGVTKIRDVDFVCCELHLESEFLFSRASFILLSHRVPNTKMNSPCKALSRAKRMWKVWWLFLMMVARPNPQVRPNSGVKMTRLLQI